MDIMDTQHFELSGGVRSALNARASLKSFKRTPKYASMLKAAIAAGREQRGTPDEQRRARLSKLEAELELEYLRRGEPLSEFSGLLRLPDPLEGR